MGSAYVEYGLGNFAFYDNSAPENHSGSLVITATGRHIDSATWRPAVIVNDLPQPLTGAAAAAAMQEWDAARGCTDVTAAPSAPIASMSTETSPAPARQVRKLSTDSPYWRRITDARLGSAADPHHVRILLAQLACRP